MAFPEEALPEEAVLDEALPVQESFSADELLPDEPTAEARHEIDRLRRAHLCRNDEVALILAILGIDQNEHPPVTCIFDHVGKIGDIIVKNIHGRTSRAT